MPIDTLLQAHRSLPPGEQLRLSAGLGDLLEGRLCGPLALSYLRELLLSLEQEDEVCRALRLNA